jgi:hypothetical protein
MAIIEQYLLKAGLPYVEDCYCEFHTYDQVIHGLKYAVSITVDLPNKFVRVSLHFIDTEPKQLFLLGALWCERRTVGLWLTAVYSISKRFLFIFKNDIY